MLTNLINKFGVRQRCMDGSRLLTELMLTALQYDHDVNFYIYEEDMRYIGAINRKLLLKMGISPERCGALTLSEVCKSMPCNQDVIFLQDGDPMGDALNDAFDRLFPYSDEVAVVEKYTGHLAAIYGRKEFYHELYSVSAKDEIENVCYREFSVHCKDVGGALSQFAGNVNSQHGEDGILAALFDRIGVTSKYAVEFGGWDGIFLSNIRNLILERGFSGLFIEGDAERARNLLENYKDYPNVDCMAAYVGFRGEYTLDRILKEKNAPEQIDLISIDIDGYDYHVWDALKEYHPRVIIIEYNPTIPNEIVFINPRNESTFCGSSAAALVELGRQKGYSLVAVTETNLIFVTDEEYDKVGIWDNSLEVLRQVGIIGDGRYFQTYDGKVLLTGPGNLIWKGGAIENSGQFIITGV